MSFMLFLSLGTMLMIFVTLFTGAKYKYPIWKRIILAVVLTFLGVIGTKIMAFIETGSFSGRSFFGAVFFTPILMIPVSLILKIKATDTLDMCAPAECIMSMLMKVNCYIIGCCYGRVISVTEYGREIRFPSQIAECVAAFVIMLILLIFICKRKFLGAIYPWYMIIYGAFRFVLNLFRETTPFIWILSAGNFWSLISIFSGSVLLIFYRKHSKDDVNSMRYKY